MAFHVEPDPGRFAPGSTLYFVSEGSELNPYGDAVYEMETGIAGTLMPVDLSPVASAPVDAYYETVGEEKNEYYQAGLLEAPDLWLWDVLVSPDEKSYTFTADRVSATRPAYVSLSLQGASDFDGRGGSPRACERERDLPGRGELGRQGAEEPGVSRSGLECCEKG